MTIVAYYYSYRHYHNTDKGCTAYSTCGAALVVVESGIQNQ